MSGFWCKKEGKFFFESWKIENIPSELSFKDPESGEVIHQVSVNRVWFDGKVMFYSFTPIIMLQKFINKMELLMTSVGVRENLELMEPEEFFSGWREWHKYECYVQ